MYLKKSFKDSILVVIAKGVHPFPFRTRQLSPSAPMVLGSLGPGRVGRCQDRVFKHKSMTVGPPVIGRIIPTETIKYSFVFTGKLYLNVSIGIGIFLNLIINLK